MTPLETTLLTSLLIAFPITLLSFVLFLDQRQKNLILQGKSKAFELKKYYQTPTEKHFLENLKKLSALRNLEIFPQVHLSTFMQVKDDVYDIGGKFDIVNKLFVDFAVFDHSYTNPLLVIELNDRSHTFTSRIRRDEFVNRALESVNIPILSVPIRDMNNLDLLEEQISKLLVSNVVTEKKSEVLPGSEMAAGFES